MLMHHFGSKEELIAAVMKQVRARMQSLFQTLLSDSEPARTEEFLRAFWKALTTRPNLPYIRLLFEVQLLAIQNPERYRRYLAETSVTWRRLIERALPPANRSAAGVTLNNAVIDGLLLELLSTGDLRRTSKALAIFTGNFSRPKPRGLSRDARSGRKSRE